MKRVGFALIALFVTLSAKSAPLQREPARTVLIFSDVTSSLTASESRRVGELTASVLSSLGEGTRFALYAIQSDAEAPPYHEAEVPMPRNSRERDTAEEEAAALQDAARNHLADLYCSINWNDARRQQECRNRQVVPRPQEDLRSCILRSLQQAAKAIEEAEASNGAPVELVFISDMVEECGQTPFGRRVRLTAADLPKEVATAGNIRVADLHGARVTIIVPRVLNGDRPPGSTPLDFATLESFWQTVFTLASADMKSWYFNTSLPQRMRRTP